MNDAPLPTYLLDDLRIDLARQRVTRGDGAPLEVAGLSFQLLRYLVEQGDRVVGFDELIAQVWAPAVVNEETVTQRVKLLRQALGDDGRNPRYLRSVRARGYQLCVAPRLEPSVARAPRARHRAYAWGVGLVLVALLTVLSVFIWPRPHAPVAAADAREELLQRARYYAGIGQNENNERAIALYEQALAADPADVMAGIGLSRALSARMCLYNGGPDATARAQALAEAAIAHDPGDGAAHNALAYVYDCRGNIDAAIAEYERAFALDPAERVDSRASAANLYAAQGRLAAALENNLTVERSGANLRFLDLQIARNLELLGFAAAAEQRYARIFRLYPDNVFGNLAWPRFLFVQGRYADADAALAEALQRPPHPQLFLLAGELALLRGEQARAADMFGRAAALRPHQSLPTSLSRLYGTPAPDRAWLGDRAAKIAADAADRPDEWIEIALLRAAAADRDGAIAALGRAVDGGFRDQAWLQISPLWRPIAGEPRFAEVIDRISRALAAERAQALAAAWFPQDLLNANAAVPAK